MDLLGLSLLISPLAWEHHYVMAVPIVVWAVSFGGQARLIRVGLATILVLCIPTFDVFPLSYHRILGLFLLLQSVQPADVVRRIANSGATMKVSSSGSPGGKCDSFGADGGMLA
jgi:hypothetical protein